MTYSPPPARRHPSRHAKAAAVATIPLGLVMIAAGFVAFAAALLAVWNGRILGAAALAIPSWAVAYAGGWLLNWSMSTLRMDE